MTTQQCITRPHSAQHHRQLGRSLACCLLLMTLRNQRALEKPRLQLPDWNLGIARFRDVAELGTIKTENANGPRSVGFLEFFARQGIHKDTEAITHVKILYETRCRNRTFMVVLVAGDVHGPAVSIRTRAPNGPYVCGMCLGYIDQCKVHFVSSGRVRQVFQKGMYATQRGSAVASSHHDCVWLWASLCRELNSLSDGH